MADIKPDTGDPERRITESEMRRQWISVAAYYKAEARGFCPGHELEDWMAAERDYIEIKIAAYLEIAEEDGGMTIIGLRQLATAIGVENPERLNSGADLIRAIQNVSQNYVCFQFETKEFCKARTACQWKKACRQLIAVWKR